jgi:hypothetical protein
MKPTGILLRPADSRDIDLLMTVLIEAINWDGARRVTQAQVESDPALSHYIDGWPKPSDYGTVALKEHGETLGAVWCRLFDSVDPGFGFVDEDTPEVGMGVLAGHRGIGIGTR